MTADSAHEAAGRVLADLLADGNTKLTRYEKTQICAVLTRNAKLAAENARMREERNEARATAAAYLKALEQRNDTVAAEIEQLNKRLAMRTRQIRGAYRAGWDERGLVVTRALENATSGWNEAERRAKAYADADAAL